MKFTLLHPDCLGKQIISDIILGAQFVFCKNGSNMYEHMFNAKNGTGSLNT